MRFALPALVAVLLLAGCTSSVPAEPTTAPAATASATATPTEPPTPADPDAAAEELATTLVTGDVVPDGVYSRHLPRGMKAYETADGTRYVVEATKPLPDVVRADIQAELDAREVFWENWGSMAAKSDETGKYVLVVMESYGSISGNGADGNIWIIVGATGGMDRTGQDGTKATAVAIAERHVAAQDEQERWEIIVQNR